MSNSPPSNSPQSNPPQIELRCPQCQIEVQPIKAAFTWFCPLCAWQFTESDVACQLEKQKRDSDPFTSGPGAYSESG